jgi:hypothetical protein
LNLPHHKHHQSWLAATQRQKKKITSSHHPPTLLCQHRHLPAEAEADAHAAVHCAVCPSSLQVPASPACSRPCTRPPHAHHNTCCRQSACKAKHQQRQLPRVVPRQRPAVPVAPILCDRPISCASSSRDPPSLDSTPSETLRLLDHRLFNPSTPVRPVSTFARLPPSTVLAVDLSHSLLRSCPP